MSVFFSLGLFFEGEIIAFLDRSQHLAHYLSGLFLAPRDDAIILRSSSLAAIHGGIIGSQFLFLFFFFFCW